MLIGIFQLFEVEDIQVDLYATLREEHFRELLHQVTPVAVLRKVARVQLDLERATLVFSEVEFAERVGRCDQTVSVTAVHRVHAVRQRFLAFAAVRCGTQVRAGNGMALELEK